MNLKEGKKPRTKYFYHRNALLYTCIKWNLLNEIIVIHLIVNCRVKYILCTEKKQSIFLMFSMFFYSRGKCHTSTWNEHVNKNYIHYLVKVFWYHVWQMKRKLNENV